MNNTQQIIALRDKLQADGSALVAKGTAMLDAVKKLSDVLAVLDPSCVASTGNTGVEIKRAVGRSKAYGEWSRFIVEELGTGWQSLDTLVRHAKERGIGGGANEKILRARLRASLHSMKGRGDTVKDGDLWGRALNGRPLPVRNQEGRPEAALQDGERNDG